MRVRDAHKKLYLWNLAHLGGSAAGVLLWNVFTRDTIGEAMMVILWSECDNVDTVRKN